MGKSIGQKTKLYEAIIQDIMERIRSGELKPGDKIPKEAELVDKYKVSRITVSRALRDLEYKGFVKRIKKKGTFITEPDAPEETKADGMTIPVIALLLPFNEEFGYEILRGVEEACAGSGYYVTYHNTNYDARTERELIGKIMSDNLSGAIVYPVGSGKNIDVFSSMLINRFPFVLIDRTIEGLDAPNVVSDNFQAGYSVTSHLIGLGHRKIAFLCTSLHEAVSVAERYRGYCKALIDASIVPQREWLIEDPSPIVGSEHLDSGHPCAASRLEKLLRLPEMPTAVVAVNDLTAMHLIETALRRGIRVPEELSVAGIDNLKTGEHFIVPLTSVKQDFAGIGAKAASLVMKQIASGGLPAEPQTITMNTELVVRRSSAPPRKREY
ncbi:hypothetical protein PACILC2_00580 [Paenibacillus cisolokensis]|uniref:HTH gntR-type domain-containing protein n=1 Tax=Paenibacillus cisolokensis TaxID=1658519 RepID=A0ABQ4MZY8_9BACL|nr:GntR family transcriptional regulator [Paenibacillus cisolokensis]GIQ61490.1 hypothetical protein PACILC2_00580 [Paenibacillus cisolokensis]